MDEDVQCRDRQKPLFMRRIMDNRNNPTLRYLYTNTYRAHNVGIITLSPIRSCTCISCAVTLAVPLYLG